MRLRPIGPGIGGLYYTPLLRDSRDRTTRAIQRLPRSGTSTQGPGKIRAVWQAFVAAARRGADRAARARQAQAQALIARTVAKLDGGGPRPSPYGIGIRYY